MKAVILCAGHGTRLGDLTQAMPKCLLPISGEPLLAYNLRYLGAFGISEIAVNLHFESAAIREFAGDGSRFGVRVHYSLEEELLGTAGALLPLRGFLEGETAFLVMYGDLLIDQDLRPMIARHEEKRPLATLLLHQRPGSNSVVVMDDQGRITKFLERPSEADRAQEASPWVNSGLQILSEDVFEHIPSEGPADLPRDVYSGIVDQKACYGFALDGYRCAIDSLERYRMAQTAVETGAYQRRWGSLT